MLAGAFEGANCRGAEKVRRLREAYGEDVALEAAYGDTDGDREMLALAQEKGFKVFNGRSRSASALMRVRLEMRTPDRIELLLAAHPRGAGVWGLLKEKKRGCFYVKPKGFLHFHEDPKGMFADIEDDRIQGRTTLPARRRWWRASPFWPRRADPMATPPTSPISTSVPRGRDRRGAPRPPAGAQRPLARAADEPARSRPPPSSAPPPDVQVVIRDGAETYFSAGFDLADPDLARLPLARLEQRQSVRIGPDSVRGLGGSESRSPSPPSKATASAARRRWRCRSTGASPARAPTCACPRSRSAGT